MRETNKLTTNKSELFKIINTLSEEQVKLVSDFVNTIKKDEKINTEAFQYILDNYSKTLKGLVD